jgi:hypothetical protein
MNRSLFSSKSLAVHAVTVVVLALFGCNPSAFSTDAKLPDLSSFLTKPSDRFLVDIKELTGGHPFLGVDSPRPHAGGHVHFDNSDNLWPTGSACRFYYSIEPIAPEPSEGFYKKFISVSEGQKVRKADVIAYLYTPPKVGGCHIHFHLMIDGRKGFFAPAIFTPELAKAFHQKCNGFRWSNDGKAILPCMGYRIGAEENPFGSGAKDRL